MTTVMGKDMEQATANLPTLGELFDTYLEYAKTFQRSWKNAARIWRLYLVMWRERPATGLTHQDILDLKHELAERLSETTANRTIELLSVVFNRAIKRGQIPDQNPVRSVKKFDLSRRDRILDAGELPRFFQLLGTIRSETFRDFVLLSMFTGLQKTPLLNLMWSDLDLNRGTWIFKPTKSVKTKVIFLLPEAISILRRRKQSAQSDYVFAGSGQSGHAERLDKTWYRLAQRLQFNDLRLDDLRRTSSNPEPARSALREHYRPLPLPIPQATVVRKEKAQPFPEASPYTIPDRTAGCGPTLGELFQIYMDSYARHRAKTWRRMEQMFQRNLAEWKDAPVQEIRGLDVQRWHNALALRTGKSTANHALGLFKTVVNRCIRLGVYDGHNPAIAATSFPAVQRDRFLQRDELKPFFDAVNALRSKVARDFLLMSLYTGARSSSVQSMRWDQVNFERAEWRIPTSKNGTPQTVPLVPAAIEILKSRREKASKTPWVFTNRRNNGHIKRTTRAWQQVCRQAGLSDLKPHDLRRSMGSWEACTGASLPIIGKTLNHKSQSATAIYARLDNEPVRKAMNTAVEAMHRTAAGSNGEPTSNLEDEPSTSDPSSKYGQVLCAQNEKIISLLEQMVKRQS